MMRAVTLIRPWCWAILHAGKDVENRSQVWRSALGERLALHSGRKYDYGAQGAIDGLIGLGRCPRDSELRAGVVVATFRVEGTGARLAGPANSQRSRGRSASHA